MRLLVLGASGRTGQLVVETALQQGHTVTALVRKAASMQARSGLEIVEGTPTEQQDIEKAFTATPSDPVNGVIVALNAARASDSPFAKPLVGPTFLQDCLQNTMAVMIQHGVKRLIMMSAFGVGNSWPQLPVLIKLIFRYTNMSYQMNDHDHTDADIQNQKELDWTLVRPVMLKEGSNLPVRELGELGTGAGLTGGISRASVAAFLVKTITGKAHVKRAVVISN